MHWKYDQLLFIVAAEQPRNGYILYEQITSLIN